MLGDIVTDDLLLGRDTEDSSGLHSDEERKDEGAGPGTDGDDGDEVSTEEGEATTVEEAPVNGVETSSGLEVLAVEEANGEGTPNTAGTVDRESLERVVDAEHEENLSGSDVDDSTNGANDNSSPSVDEGAAGSDGDKASKNSVQGSKEVEDVVLELDGDEGSDTSGTGGESSRDGTAGSGLTGSVNKGEGGTRVESVPSEPKEEGSERAESGRVTRDRVDLALRVEATDTSTNDDGTAETSETSNHVNNSATGKVNNTLAENGGEPAAAPNPVGDHRVDERSQEESVSKVGVERGTLSDRSRDDSRGRGGESPLEEEVVVVVEGLSVVSRESKVAPSDEGVGARAVGESPSEKEVSEGADASVKNILQEHVLGVLGTDGTSGKHGETGLHEEDQVAGDQNEEDIEGGIGPLDHLGEGPEGHLILADKRAQSLNHLARRFGVVLVAVRCSLVVVLRVRTLKDTERQCCHRGIYGVLRRSPPTKKTRESILWCAVFHLEAWKLGYLVFVPRYDG